MRWPERVKCLMCGHDKVSRITAEVKNRRTGDVAKKRYIYQCLEKECGQQFTATTGTIFHDTHLPLNSWFLAIALMVDSKKGISANQLSRHLRVQYKTAWHLAHRIRSAMEETPEGMLTGIVEVDETYIGGKYNKRLKRRPYEKQPVVGLIQCGGRVVSKPIKKANKQVLTGVIRHHVYPEASIIMTDENRAYQILSKRGAFQHRTVNHSAGEYVRGQIHTNTIENFWSLFKRGLIGSFDKVSIKHLERYLDEFTYRFNNRETEDMFGAVVLGLVIGTALQYRALTSEEPSA